MKYWLNCCSGKRWRVTLAILTAGSCINAAELQLDGIQLHNGRAEVRFPADASSYYILWRGQTVTDIRLATDLTIGSVNQGLLADASASDDAQFYRVEKVSLLTPRDTDGDGLDDVWELMNRQSGAALNPSDADDDQDGNTVPDRLDFLRQTLRQGAARSRAVIAGGDHHSLALKTDGTLWAWGGNTRGELGAPEFLDTNAPARVGSDPDWVSVTAGNQFSFGIRTNGTLWAWGINWNGRLGLPPASTVPTPTQVGADSNWVSVAGNGNLTVGLKSDGTLWIWPLDNTNSPTRHGTDSNWVAIAGRSFAALGLRSDGTLWSLGSPASPVISQIGSDNNWSAISGGIYHALGVKLDGTLWAWNNSSNLSGYSYGQLGIPGNHGVPTQVGTASNWVAVSAGHLHSLGLRADGTLWAWGDNSAGQLGLPMVPENSLSGLVVVRVPTRVGTDTDWICIVAGLSHSLGLHADGTMTAWGNNQMGQRGIGIMGPVRTPTQLGTGTNWARVVAGRQFSFGLESNDGLSSWGYNVTGQLGIGTYENNFQLTLVDAGGAWKAVAGGGRHTLAIATNGSLWAWGDNAHGQLGDGTNIRTNQPTQVGEDTNWVAISAGGQHSVGIKADGTLWVWGRGDTGTFGDGSFVSTNRPKMIGTETNWASISAGRAHTLAIKRNRTLWAWGDNSGWVLGVSGSAIHPTQVGSFSSVAFNWVSVIAGYFQTLATKTNGTLWAWGSNLHGQLGTGALGGEELTPVQVGTGTNWLIAVVGDNHSVALKSDGSLWTWGDYWVGALGLNVTTNVVAPARVGTDTNWISIAAGASHTLATKSDGTLWAWGDNSSGQVGQPAVWIPAPVVGSNWGLPVP